jgi:hypothetical protein
METLTKALSDNLVSLVEKGEELSAPNRFETVGEAHDFTQQETFVTFPKGMNIARVRELVVPKSRKRSVGNAEAFLAVLLEEARRRDNTTGSHMTVIFTESGGVLFPDDRNRFNPDVWEYSRKTSKQLKALKAALNVECDHSRFLQVMSTLRYLVLDFQAIYLQMRRVRIDKKVSINSQPKIQNGRSGSELAINFQIEGENGGNGNVAFPAEFTCELPFASMSTVQYPVEVEVDSWLDEKALLFALRSPGLEAIQTKAIIDEIDLFTSYAKEALPELLVVTDL